MLEAWYFPSPPRAPFPARGGEPHSAVYVEYEDLGEAEDYPPQDETPDDDRLKFRFIDADIGHFMRKPRTAVAREYEAKAAAILGLLTRGTVNDPDKIADAAAYLAYGDKVAASAGELADEYEPARKFLDAIASPSSPVIGFGIAMLPLVAQLMRNHEKEIVKPVRSVRFSVKIPFRKKTVSVRIPLRVKLSKTLRAQTVEPRKCASMVFSNPDVIKALKKRGIDVAWPG
jgi:hypothetical protein